MDELNVSVEPPPLLLEIFFLSLPFPSFFLSCSFISWPVSHSRRSLVWTLRLGPSKAWPPSPLGLVGWKARKGNWHESVAPSQLGPTVCVSGPRSSGLEGEQGLTRSSQGKRGEKGEFSGLAASKSLLPQGQFR